MPPRRRRPSSPRPAAGRSTMRRPVLDDESCGAAAADDDVAAGVTTDDCSDRRQRCSCLPFCFWGASGGPVTKPDGARAKRRRRRRLSLSWLAWPWVRRERGADAGGDSKKRRRGRRLLLLLTTSLQPKKAIASVVSGDTALLPVPAAKVSGFDDAKKQSNRRPRRTADDVASVGSRQPQASAAAAAAATTSAAWSSTAPARCSRPETSPGPTTDGPAAAGGRIWRAPSRRHRSLLHQPDSANCCSGGLWTAATTLGVIVFLGRVTAVVFLCSCLYGARFVRARAASARAKNSSNAGGSSGSRRFGGDTVGVAADEKVVAELCATEECKKKVVMAGLLDRDGKTPSWRFGR
ncbi:hypothetical protein BS78_01G197900 [Paspalum vaginatum]|nr:hypothetical protein BS78_01G197900 [Paspalum vaginatum]